MARQSPSRPFLISLALHATVIGLFAVLLGYGWFAWSTSRESLQADSHAATYDKMPSSTPTDQDITNDSSSINEPVTTSPDQVRQMLEQRLDQVHNMSSDEQLEKLHVLEAPLSNMPTEHLESAASFAERSLGVDESIRQRRFEPDPKAEGRFDTNTAILYDIETITDPQTGEISYRFVYLDASGRTLEDIRLDAQASPADRRAARVYDMARDNPQMRALIQTVNRIHLANEDASQSSNDSQSRDAE